MSEPRPCTQLARRIAATEIDQLPSLASAEVRHLDACVDCRMELARRDPSALFALLALESKDDAFFTGFETRVMAGVREAARETSGGWLGAILRPRLLALAGGAAVLAVVLAVWLGSPAPHQVAKGPAETGGPPAPPVGRPSSGDPVHEASLAPLERDVAEPSPVESVASATARVISIKVGGPHQEASDIVLIVDPEMPL